MRYPLGRLRVRGALTATLVAGLVACAATGCGDSSNSSDSKTAESSIQTRARGGTLTIGTGGEPVSLDPAVGRTDYPSQRPAMLAFERLVEAVPGEEGVSPGLAETWTVDEDKSTVTFKLRRAHFANGERVTSDDVRFSLTRVMDPKVNPSFASTFRQQIETIATPDARTVVIRSPGPQPALLSWLSTSWASIVSRRAFDQIGAARFARQPGDSGSGPFRIVEWKRGQWVRLARNQRYWRAGLPHLDAVEIRTIPDDNTRMLAIRSGDVDVVDEVPASQVDAIGGAPGVRVIESPIAAVYAPWVASEGVTKPVEVRQALNYAMPKEIIQRVALGGRGRIANGAIPPLQYWDESIEAVPYDLDKAKELMRSSPTPDGFSVEMLIQSGDAVTRQTAQILQDAWAEIGVDLTVRAVDQGSLYAANSSGDWRMILFSPSSLTSHVPSEDEFAANWANPVVARYFKYWNPRYNELVRRAGSTWDEEVRAQAFAEMQHESLDNPPWLPISFTSAIDASRDDVDGFRTTFLNMWDLTETRVTD